MLQLDCYISVMSFPILSLGGMAMSEHYAIRTGVGRDWEGRERAFVALDVRYGDNYFYQERERWWFDLLEPNASGQADPNMRAKIHELMEQYFVK